MPPECLVAPLCAMSVSDENAPPYCAGQTSKARRRRTSSLFQVEGGSLLDIIGEGNLPFLLPDKPIYSHDAALAPANGLVGSVDGACQHLLQPPPPAPAAVSDVIAVNAVNAPSAAPAVVPSAAPAVVPDSNAVNTAAAEAFERWDSQPTMFPRAVFIFSGNSSPPQPPTLLNRCRLSSHTKSFSGQPVRPCHRRRHFHILPSRRSPHRHHHPRSLRLPCRALLDGGKAPLS